MFTRLRSAVLPCLALGLLSSTSLRAEPQKGAPPLAGAANTNTSSPSQELSAAQRQQVEALRDRTERQLAPLREQLNARHKELVALWSAEPPNRTAILQKESEVAGLRQKMRQLLLEQRLSLLALLTPAQRGAWRSQHGEGRMGGCGCMGGENEMGNMHGGNMHGGNMHGGMGNMHGGMGNMHGGMGIGGMPMGMDECMDCMDCMKCEGGGSCQPATPSTPAAGAPAAPRPK